MSSWRAKDKITLIGCFLVVGGTEHCYSYTSNLLVNMESSLNQFANFEHLSNNKLANSRADAIQPA